MGQCRPTDGKASPGQHVQLPGFSGVQTGTSIAESRLGHELDAEGITNEGFLATPGRTADMRLKAILWGVASVALAAAPATAQQTGDVPNPESPPEVRSLAAQWRDQALPLIGEILRWRRQLELSPAQAESIEHLAVEFAREVIRRQADRQIAVLDLVTMLEPDPTDPAKPLDLSRVEAKIRKIERIEGDLELTRLRTIEAGKAQLSAEQRAKLGGLLAGDDPPDPPDISLVAHPGGGGASGHSGGVGTHGHPGAGRPGHPSGGRTPGHPGGGRPGHPSGGTPGHSPGWHGAYREHGFHSGIHGRVFVGGWPWYWWGYPSAVYAPPPPPPSYWYYCPAYGAYYPDVTSCPEPWVVVPAG